jgi:hypothetical protein
MPPRHFDRRDRTTSRFLTGANNPFPQQEVTPEENKMFDWIDSIPRAAEAIALTVGIVYGWFRLGHEKCFGWYRKRRASPAAIALESEAEVYEASQQMLAETGATRVLLYRIHNGGGIPRVGHSIYLTAFAEVFTPGCSPIRSDFKAVLLDESYVNILVSVFKYGKGDVARENLTDWSEAARPMDVCGSSHALFYYLAQNKVEGYVAALYFSGEPTPPQHATIKKLQERLK